MSSLNSNLKIVFPFVLQDKPSKLDPGIILRVRDEAGFDLARRTHGLNGFTRHSLNRSLVSLPIFSKDHVRETSEEDLRCSNTIGRRRRA